MRGVIERTIIAANWSLKDNPEELEAFRESLFNHLRDNLPEVLVEMVNDL